VTIEQAGSIGELVAAIATVATLGYLAVQIRSSAAATREESRRAARSASAAVNLAIGQNADLAEIFNRGLADFQSLAPREATQFQFIFSELLMTQLANFQESGATSHDLNKNFGHLLRTSGGRANWEQFGSGFPAEFRALVNELLEPSAQQSAAADSA